MNLRPYKGVLPNIAPNTYVDPMAVVIGDVIIGTESSLWPHVVIRGDVHWIRIGAHTNIQDNSVLHVTHASAYDKDGYPLTVGDYVTIGHQVSLHGCTIEDHVLVGIGSIVLDGATIHANSLIAAGSLVPPRKILEGGYLWKGNPVQKVRSLTPEETNFLRYSAEHYVHLKNEYLSADGSVSTD